MPDPNFEPFFQILAMLCTCWIVIAGFGWMFGGQNAAFAVIKAPIRFFGGLLISLVAGLWHFATDLLGAVLRGIGRLVERGARRLFRLPQRP